MTADSSQSDSQPTPIPLPGARLLPRWLEDEAGLRDLPARLQTFLDIAQVLARAHARGRIHGGLTPELVALGELGEVAILGWDSTSLPLHESGEAALRDLEGRLPASHPYLAPELLRSPDCAPGVATDLYGLGGLLYLLITHSPPLEADNPEDLRDRILSHDIAPPSQRASEDVPAQLEAEVLRALAFDPDKRHRDVQELRRAVAPWVQDAEPDERSLQREQRISAAFAIAALVWLCLTAVTVYFLLAARRTFQQAEDTRGLGERAESRAAEALARAQAAELAAERDRLISKDERAAADAALATAERRFTEARAALSQVKDERAALDRRIAEAPPEVTELLDRAASLARQLEAAEALVERRGRACEEARAQLIQVKSALADERLRGALLGGAELARQGDVLAARQRFEEARQGLEELGAGRALPAWLGLWSLQDRLATQLWRLDAPSARALALSPDGATAALGLESGLIELIDLRSSRAIAQLSGHESRITALAAGPGGRWLSGDASGALWLWESSRGRRLELPDAPAAAITALSWDPEGALVAAARGPEIELWNTRRGELMQRFEPLSTPVRALCQTSSGLVALGEDGQLARANSASARPELLAPAPGARALQAGPDGWVALGGRGISLSREGQEARSLPRLHAGAISQLLWTRRGLVSAGEDGRLVLRRLDGRLELLGALGDGPPLALAAGGDLVASLRGGALTLWSLELDRSVTRLEGTPQPVRRLALSPNGELLATAEEGGALTLRERQTGFPLRRFELPELPAELAFSADGARLLARGARELWLWDLETGAPLLTSAPSASCAALAATPDTLVFGGDRWLELQPLNPAIKGWRLRYAHGEALTGLAITGDRVLSSGRDGFLRSWVLETGLSSPGWTEVELGSIVSRFAVSADGQRAILVEEGARLSVVELARRSNPKRMGESRSPILSVSALPEARYALSIAASGDLRLWDLERAEACWQASSRPTTTAAQSRSGNLALGDGGPNVSLIDLRHAEREASLRREVELAIESLRAEPRDGAALLTLARWYAFQRQREAALDILDRASAVGAPTPLLLRLQLLLQLGRFDAARSLAAGSSLPPVNLSESLLRGALPPPSDDQR